MIDTLNYIEQTVKDHTLKNLGLTETEYTKMLLHTYTMKHGTAASFKNMVLRSDYITVLGDYDCDGITATYIMFRLCHNKFQKQTDFMIPNRFSDGYGITSQLVDRIYEKKKEFIKEGKICTIITVDNGIAGFDAIQHANDLGFHVIVTDHHELLGECPDADLVIDPKVKECNPFEYDGYCGAGVAYKIAEQFIEDPKVLTHLRAFAALGTVGDSMPMTGDNYKMVKSALYALSHGSIPRQFLYLSDAYTTITQKEFKWMDVTETDFGFLFAPILNAQSRMMDNGASIAETFLLHATEDAALKMIRVNEERKTATKNAVALVKKKIDKEGIKSPLWLYIPKLCMGLTGLVSGSITSAYGVPSIVVTDNPYKEDALTGSARSIPGFDLLGYLQSVPQDIFLNYGGHKEAAGVTVDKKMLTTALSLPDLGVYIKAETPSPDLVVEEDDLFDVYQTIREYAPYGVQNPAPVVGVKLNTKTCPPRLCGMDQNTAIFFGGSDTKVPTKVLIFHYKETMKELVKNTDEFLALGDIQAEWYRGNRSLSLIGNAVIPVG